MEDKPWSSRPSMDEVFRLRTAHQEPRPYVSTHGICVSYEVKNPKMVLYQVLESSFFPTEDLTRPQGTCLGFDFFFLGYAPLGTEPEMEIFISFF